MQAETANLPDWRDEAAYALLLDADRSLFAWEWLRRDAHYRVAAEEALSSGRHGLDDAGARRFGLVAFEAPQLGVPNARPIWRSDAHPFVLAAEPGNAASPVDSLDWGRFSTLMRVIATDAAEHLLLSDGLHAIRLDGPRGAFGPGPVSLRYSLEGLVSAEAPLLTLRRFLVLCRTGHFSRSLHPRELRARRWIKMLRAHDALVAGADQRQIAEALLSRSAADPCWRTREPSVRSQTQRLVRRTRQLAAGEFVTLLR